MCAWRACVRARAGGSDLDPKDALNALQRALADPLAMAALQEVASNPRAMAALQDITNSGGAALVKYEQDADVMAALSKLQAVLGE